MKTLYFDHNIIIDIHNKRKPVVVDRIKELDRNEFQILFSPAHIEEIAALKMRYNQDDSRVSSYLNLLTELTFSKCLLPYKRTGVNQVKKIGVYISDEDPITTYRRVIKNYDRNCIVEEHQKDKIARGILFEKEAGVSARETNQINIQREFDLFRPRLYQIVMKNYISLRPSLGEYLPEIPPSEDEIKKFSLMGEYFPLHEMIVEKLFEFLEVRRFFPDKPKQFFSGVHDTTHVIYAAYCDVFVTHDKKLLNKARETYKWLGVNTLVLTPDEFVKYLEKQ
ncbi:hypothetical protein LZ617_25125 [Escherichia coli]|uniref:hypothetical protein n=1 Tax=Escherichia coli TaxID=562 RepID=UPI0016A96754|nr:hypothetical protein [Escherichia coli]EFI9568875.1 hypothetical protein [Escherichia coli]EGB1671919.1 hypothetical protein [Escherichia coli]MCE9976192.1 hypothetical protein [Escherichia coli]MCE9988439.1 hypothetical protein [Escherichia coli]